ncbi:MAG: polyphosphate polymerase domain-containing protein [Rikenellaceae bacterium]|nr:polyphosphate polymerase domain-containing protein [Rikenellaceae bacterium]
MQSGILYDLESVTGIYRPISLKEMKDIRLMDRDDKKYIATASDIRILLEKAEDDYLMQELEGRIRISHYQTIYYDTPYNELFLMHQNGKKFREKIRERNYVDSSLAFCEVKRKNNHGRTSKNRIETSFGYAMKSSGIKEFVAKNSSLDPTRLVHSLFNDFYRITLVNKRMTERVTIDFDISFMNFLNGVERELSGLGVIEIKRDGNTPSPISDILKGMRVHPARFSKFCVGCLITNKEMKRNNFKSDLIKMDKLTDYRYGYSN